MSWDKVSSVDKNLRSLAREIKNPLTAIARQTELRGDVEVSRQIELVMMLLDGYLLSAQTEYGQLNLPLESLAVGAALQQASEDIKPLAKQQDIMIETDFIATQPVFTHRSGLRLVINMISQLALSVNDDEPTGEGKMKIISYRNKSGNTMVAVLTQQLQMSPNDLKLASILYGDAHLAMSARLADSGIRLAIASQIAEAMGSRLRTLRYGGRPGLGLELMKSQQLQLL